MDHAAIFLQIAGTYTPLVLIGFPAGDAWQLLGIVWLGALAGMLQPLALPHAPKPLKTALYVALGRVDLGGWVQGKGAAARSWSALLC